MDETPSTLGDWRHRLRGEGVRARLALLFVVLVLAGAAYKWWTRPTMEEVAQKIAELNKKLPAKPDAMTRLDKVILGTDDIVYRYTLLGGSSASLAAANLGAILEPQVKPAVCAAPMLQTLMRNDYVVRYQYRGDDGKLITEIVVRPHDCGGLLAGCTLAVE